MGRPRKPRPDADDIARLEVSAALSEVTLAAARIPDPEPEPLPGLEDAKPLTVDEMILAVSGEFSRRLKNPSEARDIPPTALANVLSALNRMKAQGDGADDEEQDDNTPVVEMVRGSLLPPERKIELLELERERLTAELALVNATIEEVADHPF